MTDNSSKASAKTSDSPRQAVLSYADIASNCSIKLAASADATQPASSNNAPAEARGVEQRLSTSNDASGSGSTSAAAPAVRLPSRDAKPSAAIPAVQFGSFHQQTRLPSPLAEQHAELGANIVTSGGVPAALAKGTAKPKFGSTQSSFEDSAATNPAVGNAAGSSVRPAQRGRKQQSQKRQSDSQASNHSGHPKVSAPSRKDNRSSLKSTSPLGQISQMDASVQQPPPHYASNALHYHGHPQVRFPSKNVLAAPHMQQAGVYYAPHYMVSQSMSQPTGYAMQPAAGWAAPLPHQFAYMHTNAPGYEHYYHVSLGAGSPPPHSMAYMPSYGMSSQMGYPSSVQGPVGAAPMPSMSASPLSGQNDQAAQSRLRASAQAFVPTRRPVRIVNPNTNEEVDISQERLAPAAPLAAISEECESVAALPAESSLAVTTSMPAIDEANAALLNADPTSVETIAEPAESQEDDSVNAKTEPLATTTLAEVDDKTAIAVEAASEEAAAELANSAKIADQDDGVATADNEAEEDVDTQHSPSLSPANSSQVTFSEPSPDSRRALSPAEILELYSGESDVPTLVGEILRYPRVFLERFNGLCQPPRQFNPELVDTDDHRSDDRSSDMRRSTSGSSRPRDSTFQSGFGGMGNFRHSQARSPLATSDERYSQSTNELWGRSEGGRESRGGRTNSTRGGRNNNSGHGRRGGRGGFQHGREHADSPRMRMANVTPLAKSENRYIAKSLRLGKDAIEDDMLEQVFDRGIRALLNKLTFDNFDAISDGLLTWGNKSVNETDGRILRHLVALVYQKAIDEPNWALMYARLCHKLIHKVNMQIEDHSLRTKDGKYLCGGHLVRKYLLTKCQEDFERGWKVDIPEDIKSEEFCNAMAIKRRGLGLVRFVGELFLLDILKPNILHECVKRLLSNVETPDDEEIESLVKLLITAGKKMDTPEAKHYMDVYFARMQAMSVNKSLEKRIRFTLMDVLEMRQNGWVARGAYTGPKTIAEIHKDVERKKQADAEMYGTPLRTGSRPNSHSGRGDGLGGRRAGRTTIGGASGNGRNDQSQLTGDISGFGNLSRSRQHRTTGASAPGANPFSTFAGGSRGWSSSSLDNIGSKRDDLPGSLELGPGRRASTSSSRASSTVSTPKSVSMRNMFDLLTNEEEDELLASAHVETNTTHSQATEPTMDAETMQRKIKGMVDEYVSIKDDTDFIEYFKELGEANYQKAVFELANNIMDRRIAHAEQVARGIQALCAGKILSEDVAAAGLAEYSEMLEDIVVDAPNAYKYFGMLMAAAQVPRSRIADNVLRLIN